MVKPRDLKEHSSKKKYMMQQPKPRQAVQTDAKKAVKRTFTDDYYEGTVTGKVLGKLLGRKKKSSGW